MAAGRVQAPDGIAIIGAGLRLPGGITSLGELWTALEGGRDLVGEVPADRFDADRVYDPRRRPGKTHTKAGGFLTGIDSFDAAYFGISPKEAARLDPRQRLLLECAVEALDDAAIDPRTLAGADTAVVTGACFQDYYTLQSLRRETANAYTMVGSSSNNTANRVSHFLDVRGPSFAVDTACSSSLIALHQACEILRAGRSQMALVGAVNIMLDPFGFVGFSAASMLSPTGRCRPFSGKADGYVRAEAAGMVILKPLAAALEHGDRVHGVLLATEANSDGRTVGLSLPNARAQTELLERVYRTAGVAPREVSYVEAHGTGTQAGDPIECTALGEVLGRDRAEPLPIGSVKSNLGHSEAASGLAGLFKALLVLRERRIPSTLHAEPVNDEIDFPGLGLEPVPVAKALATGERLIVGVNSFGFGGANGHAVVASPPDISGTSQPRPEADPARLPLVVSARTEEALSAAAARWSEFLDTSDPGGFYDVAHTARRRGSRHPLRCAVLAEHPSEAAAKLRALAAGDPASGAARGAAVSRGRLGFVFSGNGSQWPGMGAALLAEDAAFRAEVTALDEILTPMLGWSVIEELSTADHRKATSTKYAQPLLFALQGSLVAALAARGVHPSAVAGHSVGEVAAAYCAGALDRVSACKVIVERSAAQERTAGAGRMAAAGLGRDDAESLLAEAGCAGRVVVAAVNGARDVTLAGEAAPLESVGLRLDDQGIAFRDLGLNYAFHSPVMDPLHRPLLDALADLAPADTRTPLVSTVTGATQPGRTLDGDHWWRNLRDPVQFAAAVGTLTEAEGCDVLIEIGPHPVLNGYLRRCTIGRDEQAAVIPTLSRSGAGTATLDTALARVLAAGGRVDWSPHLPRRGKVVSLPAYPWQKEHHWNGSPDWWNADGDGPPAEHPAHPLLGRRRRSPDPSWVQTISLATHAWLADHRVGQVAVMPAAAYLDMALSAGRSVHGGPAEVVRLSIERTLPLPFDAPEPDVRLHTSLSDGGVFQVSSQRGVEAEWSGHVRGRVRKLAGDPPPGLDLEAISARCPKAVTADDHYAHCAAAGLPYGPAFRPLTGLRVGTDEVLARYTSAAPGRTAEADPAAVDGGLQAALSLLLEFGEGTIPYLPVSVDAVRCWRTVPSEGTAHVRRVGGAPGEVMVDVVMTDPAGTVTLEMSGFRLRRFAGARPADVTMVTEVLRAAPLPGTSPDAGDLPSPAETFAAAADTIAELQDRFAETRHFHAHHRLLEMMAHFTVRAVRDIVPGHDGFEIADLIEAGVRAEHTRLLRMLFRLAVRYRLLAEDAGRWLITGRPEPEEIFQAIALEHPGHGVELQLFGVAGRHLGGVLLGRDDPLDLFFADSDLAAQHYDHEPLVSFQNGVCAELLRQIVKCLQRNRPLRILEVGAGTGGTTAAALPVLPAERTRYTYTDISSAFFQRAKNRFASYGFLDYRTLDLEADLAEQGFSPGSFDLVIAANVLHATDDLRSSLRNIAELLADNGRLLAVEVHDEFYSGPTFGLLDSYWPGDPDLRPEGPMLSREGWVEILDECGFTATAQTEELDAPHQSISTILTSRAPRAPRDRQAGAGPGSVHVAALTGGGLDDFSRRLVGELAARDRRVEGDWDANADPMTWRSVLADARTSDVVLVAAGDEETSAEKETEGAVRAIAALRAAASAASGIETEMAARLWVVCGTQAGIGRHPAALPGARAALWGAARTLATEAPGLDVRRVMLTGAGEDPDALAGRLADELESRTDEDEVTLTAGGRFVSRACPVTPPHVSSMDVPSFALRIDEPGLHYRLRWLPVEIPEPEPDEIVVRVGAAALNYRDVLTALDLIPMTFDRRRPERVHAGLDCAGTVVAVGSSVGHLSVGDRVAGVATSGFGSHAPMSADLAFRIPDGMTCAEAATLPVAFATVQESLHHRAGLRAEETVLVHSGAGGVGLAVLQYARRIGARVIATAGTPAKRDLLRLLGVRDVLDSRSLDFAGQVLDLTGGQGVDVVVNSLAGEGLVRSLEILKPYGRFVELGKRDLLSDSALPMAPFLHNLTFIGVDVMDRFVRGSKEDACALMSFADQIGSATYRPLLHRTYSAARIHEAFEQMRHSRHTGKIVVTFDEPVGVEVPMSPPPLDPEATYLITGGLGGLGAATAGRLAERGARHLRLLGRRGAATPEASELLDHLRRSGVEAVADAVDVADAEALRELFAEVHASGRRLAGVVHAAMVLEDARLDELDDRQVRRALAAKMRGGLLLDELTRDPGLDFFVVYSSFMALIGNQRQAPYVAANMALESMVLARREAGLPGLALQWGTIGDVGVTRRLDLVEKLDAAGLAPLSSREALAELDPLLGKVDHPVLTVARVDWNRLAQMTGSISKPRLAGLLPAQAHAQAEGEVRRALAAGEQEPLTIVETALADLLAQVLLTTPDRLDRTRPLDQLGMDSLMGAEFGNLIQDQLNCRLPVVELLGAANLSALAQRILPLMRPTAETGTA
ncbi:type I polyketide synthase [Actinomadura rubrisoli]|uniref:SDR family NAD(P)-dependent oxidoreductase n=1 Tax=Actinomadura rubrisoli TaxID=2530368 RepID=A0A4R5CGI6_9ACTN|nr:type I polyketide synthase [Actinomadura rubrisoli]TDD98136.1 SDR family NAD(P)-dependent oxidoreductase [Actinomadura rubrisoli]